jgi:hypothetical protein
MVLASGFEGLLRSCGHSLSQVNICRVDGLIDTLLKGIANMMS